LNQAESARQLLQKADAWMQENPDAYLGTKLLHQEAQALIDPVTAK
jgi:hypothetical protein